jgi:hypothetical protein
MKKCELYVIQKLEKSKSLRSIDYNNAVGGGDLSWSVHCNLQYNKKENEEVSLKDILSLVRSYSLKFIRDIQKTWQQVHTQFCMHVLHILRSMEK